MDILKLLDVNESNKWIVHDANLFFTWISQNVDSSNILSEKEFLINQDISISSDDVEQLLRDIEYEYPGLLSITEKDVFEKEKEASMIEDELMETNDRILRMDEYDSTQLKLLAKIEQEKIETDLEIKFLTEEIIGKMEKLENIRKSNAKDIETSNKHLLKSSSAFMYQMPSDKFINNMNKFCLNLDTFMRQNLNVRRAHYEEGEDHNKALIKERNKIMDLEGKILESDLNLAGIKFAMENIEGYLSFFKPNILETNVLVGDWVHEEEIMKEQYEVALEELQILNRQQSQSSVILDDFGRKKQHHNIEILKKLSSVQMVTDDVTSICSALWAASQLDGKRLENRIDNSEEIGNDLYECRRRISELERYIKSDIKNSYNNNMLRRFQDILKKHLSINSEKLSTIEACVGEILSFQERLDVLTNSIVDQKYFAHISNAIKDVEMQTLKLHPYIHKGPIYKPCLYDSSFFAEIHEKDKRKKELETFWQEIRAKFQTNINDPFNNDKFYRMKELLSTWFLMEPRKVILAVKEVQKRAAEIGSSGYKALNVTIGADKSKLN